MFKNYSVYWIKHKNHSNPYAEGYVGISKNPESRFKDHMKCTSNHPLPNAIKKYKEDIEFTIILENITEAKARLVERQYRPEREIGWNLAEGGGMPPSNKGTKRPGHSAYMKGEGNSFFGKHHSIETRKRLSERKKGKNHPFFGKKREHHSILLKEKKGKDYPKFKGYFITPLGEFDSYKDACAILNITSTSLYNYCIKNNKVKITRLSIAKSGYIKTLDFDVFGMSYEQLGFGFRAI